MKREKRDEQSGHQAGDGSFSELHRRANTTHGFSNPDAFHVFQSFIFLFSFFLIYFFFFVPLSSYSLSSLLSHLSPLENHSFLPLCISSWFLDDSVTVS